jgi:transcriptional regulator with XRE-family HTH domain
VDVADYRYRECGLPNVVIKNAKIVTDDDGERTIAIPNVRSLHRAIAEAIVELPVGLGGPEIRFLRTELGLTQAELGNLLHKEALTISRWERGETPVDPNAETVLRALAIQRLKLNAMPTIDRLSKLSVPSAKPVEIKIDGSDPTQYRPAA